MKSPLVFFLLLILASCRTAFPGGEGDPSPGTPALEAVVATPERGDPGGPRASPPPPPPSSSFAPRAFETRTGGIALQGFRFHASTHRLVVADQAGGPGSGWPDARAAAGDGLAAINASFFNPDGSPLGLVATRGERRGSINRASSLGSGFFVESPAGNLDLIRREAFNGAREAVQAGPFLVDQGRTVPGLSDTRSSARSFIATDGSGGWIAARTGPCSLAELGRALQDARIDGVAIHHALNLDGGRSSEIWISGDLPGGPLFVRPLWNKPVRNFLVLHPR